MEPGGQNKVICIDIGNSSIKFAVCENVNSNHWQKNVRISDLEHVEFASHPQFQFAADISFDWCICSVNHQVSDRLKNWIKKDRRHDRIYEIKNNDFDFGVIPQPVEKIGTDRLVAIAAAIELYCKPDPYNLIIVDCGTAVTIDAVDRDGRFLGGTIRPGIRLQRLVLHQYTDALPDLSNSPAEIPDGVFGKSTEAAILAGTEYGELAAITAIAQIMDDQMDGESIVVVTGGGSNWILDAVLEEWEYVPDLVLQGIRIVARKKYLRSSS